MSTLTISLGAQTFEITQLTIRQLRDLRVGDVAAAAEADDQAVKWKDIYGLCVGTIAVAVRKTHPELTEEAIWDLCATEDELAAARRQILVFAGMRSPEPTIADLRAQVIAKERELEQLKKTLAEREMKAKVTGE